MSNKEHLPTKYHIAGYARLRTSFGYSTFQGTSLGISTVRGSGGLLYSYKNQITRCRCYAETTCRSDTGDAFDVKSLLLRSAATLVEDPVPKITSGFGLAPHTQGLAFISENVFRGILHETDPCLHSSSKSVNSVNVV